MALPPLKLSKEQITKSGLRGHSFHGTLSDIARSIGENPRLPFTPSPDLAQGFNATELGELGRWERTPQEKADARQAAAILAGGGGRRTEASDPAAAMSLRYSSGQGRSGCHDAQLRVRTRMVRLVRAAISHYGHGWENLPISGLESWRALFPYTQLDDLLGDGEVDVADN